MCIIISNRSFKLMSLVVQERKPVANLRTGTGGEAKRLIVEEEDAMAKAVHDDVQKEAPVVRKMSASREQELIFRAVLILGAALTALFFYVRYNTVTLPAKKL
eukprot:Colp12_sorted_trinity150504_noHs@11263